jgi:hypothetical protein
MVKSVHIYVWVHWQAPSGSTKAAGCPGGTDVRWWQRGRDVGDNPSTICSRRTKFTKCRYHSIYFLVRMTYLLCATINELLAFNQYERHSHCSSISCTAHAQNSRNQIIRKSRAFKLLPNKKDIVIVPLFLAQHMHKQ